MDARLETVKAKGYMNNNWGRTLLKRRGSVNVLFTLLLKVSLQKKSQSYTLKLNALIYSNNFMKMTAPITQQLHFHTFSEAF